MKKTIALSVLLCLMLACALPAVPSLVSVTGWPSLTPFPGQTMPPSQPAGGSTSLPQTETVSTEPTPLLSGTVMREVVYCRMDGTPLRMDILFPSEGVGPWPVVLIIHGGGWVHGSKLNVYENMDVSAFTHAGYVAVAVNYRLAPGNAFPAMIEDLKCAVRFLRANAEDFNLDPNRFAALGSSAGGHLAALLGTTDASAGWDMGEYLDQSSRVQAVISLAGASDLTQMALLQQAEGRTNEFLGSDESIQEKLAWASPTSYITHDDPPFLLIHGDKDEVVEFEQSQILYDLLLDAGVPAQLITVKNANHNLLPANSGTATAPDSDHIYQLIILFLDTVFQQSP